MSQTRRPSPLRLAALALAASLSLPGATLAGEPPVPPRPGPQVKTGPEQLRIELLAMLKRLENDGFLIAEVTDSEIRLVRSAPLCHGKTGPNLAVAPVDRDALSRSFDALKLINTGLEEGKSIPIVQTEGHGHCVWPLTTPRVPPKSAPARKAS